MPCSSTVIHPEGPPGLYDNGVSTYKMRPDGQVSNIFSVQGKYVTSDPDPQIDKN